MIIDWIKRWRDKVKQTNEARRTTLIREEKDAINACNAKYFAGIEFPIIILSKNFFTSVSSLREYYLDVDIHRWGIEKDSELVDSEGKTYTLTYSEKSPPLFVPNEKTGTMECEELKTRLAPLLYLPRHKKQIGTKKSVREIIELLLER